MEIGGVERQRAQRRRAILVVLQAGRPHRIRPDLRRIVEDPEIDVRERHLRNVTGGTASGGVEHRLATLRRRGVEAARSGWRRVEAQLIRAQRGQHRRDEVGRLLDADPERRIGK